MSDNKIIYYKDELNDEFSTAKITPRIIDEKYKYIHKNPIWNACHLLIQQVISIPIKIGYAKLKFRTKCIGKEKVKPYKKQGYFIYGNHTQSFADTFMISNYIYPKRNYLIVNPENVSMNGLHTLVEMLGAIPIPNKINGMKNFLETVKIHIKKGHSITIFPEAHIWPYYTKIRPFKDVSFKYPVELEVPTFCVTNTYHKRGKNKVQIISYLDGPFWPDKNLETAREKKQNLRNKVYNQMLERSKESNYEVIKYEKEKNVYKA